MILSIRSPSMHAAYSVQPMSSDLDMTDDESDSYSVMSAQTFAPSVASSATSYDWDMRSASPAPSIFSVTSSLRTAAYRHEYGRGLNNYSDIYRLPADDEEFQRLDKQHIMFMEVMGKYPPPLAEVLADDTPGESKTCADLGCGSGSWILDVARDFPHCSAVAIDLVPMQDVNMPPNCRSEVDDVNLGLQHYYGDFNVIHARLISSGIRDYNGLVDQIAQALRSRGLLDLTEFDFRVYDANKKPILPTAAEHQIPWLARWMNLVHVAVEQRGGEPDAANHLYRWATEHPIFEDVHYREFWFQTSPWRESKDYASMRQNRIGHVMREDILAFLKSGRPLLLGNGMQESVLDDIEERARRELLECRCRTYIRVEHVYARKRLQ